MGISRGRQSSGNEIPQSPIELLDDEEFKKLDDKIKKGEATEDEQQKFAELVPRMARLQAKDF